MKKARENRNPNRQSLEQHIRARCCDGVQYKIVAEAPKAGEIQRQSISPSRAAADRALQRALGGGKKKRSAILSDSTWAVNASENAAAQECEAERREHHRVQSAAGFQKRIQKAVNDRQQRKLAEEVQNVQRHAAELRQLISDIVVHAYKPPPKYNRDEMDEDEERAPLKAQINLVGNGPPGKGKSGKSAATGVTDDATVTVEIVQVQIALGIPKGDARVEDTRYARDLMFRAQTRIATAEEEKRSAASKASKRRRRGTKAGASLLGMGSVLGSMKSERSPSYDFSNSSPQRTLDRDQNQSTIFAGTGGGSILGKDKWGSLATTLAQSFKKPKNLNVRDWVFSNPMPAVLNKLNLSDYDTVEDIGRLEVHVEKQITEKLKTTWKTIDEGKLRDLIRKCVVTELARIEERKKVRNVQKDIDKEARDRRRAEKDAMDASMITGMQGSPGKPTWGGLAGQLNQSPGSSPTRTQRGGFGSPGRRGAGGGSEVDTQTTKTGGASNVKSGLFGGQAGAFGGSGFPGGGFGAASLAGGPGAALASLLGGSPDRKSGLSMLNPSLRKMNQRGGSVLGGARSQTSRVSRSRSQGTRRTGRTGTMSRKSRATEIDWEAMEIEEMDVMIEGAEAELATLAAEKRATLRKTGLSKGAKAARLEPIEQRLTELRVGLAQLLQIKNDKIPFFDKLPKDNQFYAHYMQNLAATRIREAAQCRADDDSALFQVAIEEIDRERERAGRADSPQSRKGSRKRELY